MEDAKMTFQEFVKNKISNTEKLEGFEHLYDILLTIVSYTSDLTNQELNILLKSLNKCYDLYQVDQVTVTMRKEDYKRTFREVE